MSSIVSIGSIGYSNCGVYNAMVLYSSLWCYGISHGLLMINLYIYWFKTSYGSVQSLVIFWFKELDLKALARRGLVSSFNSHPPPPPLPQMQVGGGFVSSSNDDHSPLPQM
jgi:hypothetical protein